MQFSTTHNGLGRPEPEPGLTDLASLADQLVEQVADARRHYGELRAELDSVDAGTTTDATAPDQEPKSDRDIRQEQREEGRLLALRHALEGSSADEARAELRGTVDPDDADAIVDSVFVPEEQRRRRLFSRFLRRA